MNRQMPRESESLPASLTLAERYRRDGRLADAAAICRSVLQAQPDADQAWHLLGVIAQQSGRIGEAIEHFERVVGLAPDVARHHANLGEMYRLAGRFDEAIAVAERAVALDPRLAEPLNNLGRIALVRGRSDQALDYCRRAIAIKPDFADAHNNLGSALKDLGRLDEARRAYARAIALDPGAAAVYLNFADLHKFVAGDPHLVAMEALAAKAKSLPAMDRWQLDFALGKAYGDLNDHRRSFQRLLAGNAGKRAHVNYNETSALALFDHIERAFTAELVAAKSGHGDPSPLPIFVLGMPRSGTTLVEQILASHAQVFGGGELNIFYETLQSVRGPDGKPVAGPRLVAALDGKAFADIGGQYVARVRKLAPAAPHITDKMPYNYHFIGLIHLTLPNATIIHVVRDPVDTCLSCFSKLIELDYSHDLAELGRYYKRYERLMAHWRRVLPPGRMLEVRYEDVVADLEGQTRRLLDHCGLRFDERCIAFHETQRAVRTASAAQVRQPIYKDSIGRWRRYEEFLGPLLAELGRGTGEASDGASSSSSGRSIAS
jgi:tetratricopeptide (TPR) repeat protein